MRRSRTLALLALASAAWPVASIAQPPPESPPTPLAIRPAAAPRPALKYRLVPERLALVPGNAAIFYHRAVELVTNRRGREEAEAKGKQPPAMVDEQVSGWIAGPIGEIPVEKAKAVLDSFKTPLAEVELAATRASCDWEFDRRPEGISLLLFEIQQMRPLARLVALRARLAILDGKVDEAMHWIETGLVMGRHVARGPIIVQALVGIAIDMTMVKCLEDLIQGPATPSLYWALADRPRPFVDMREPFEGERYLLEKEIPGLDDLARGIWGLDQARKFADVLQSKLYQIAYDTGPNEGSDAQRLGIVAMTTKIYPKARKALIAGGRPEAEVDAMPVVQVAALSCHEEYRRLLDETYKWMNIPAWQSAGRVDSAGSMTAEAKRDNPLLAMFHALTPTLDAARLSALRLDRHLDALECVEAIRLHAASRDGKWPATLEAMADAPAPLDPGTGRPFAYKLEGDSATLSAPPAPGGPDRPSQAIRYTLKPAR